MANLQSNLLSGNQRLQQAANGPPSIRKRPPDDDADAVRRIQKALIKLGFNLPISFPNGPAMEPDGRYGPETEKAVRDFQKREFAGQMSEWDGRCGPNTLGKMDVLLSPSQPAQPMHLLLRDISCKSNCRQATPGPASGPGGQPDATGKSGLQVRKLIVPQRFAKD